MSSENKIIVIGCPGSGKSTFSRKLAEITKIPLYHSIFCGGIKTVAILIEIHLFLNKKKFLIMTNGLLMVIICTH